MRVAAHWLLVLGVMTLGLSAARADDWPQWLGPKRDSVWRETGIVDQFPAGGLRVKWRVPIDGGYSGPAVASGRVYVTDYVTGGDRSSPDPGKTDRLQGRERVLCFNAADGKLLWKHEYDCPYELSFGSGPRCTPTVAGGKVYALGAMGHLVCLDAATGGAVWSRDLKKDYRIKAPMWGFCGHPLADGQKLYVTVGGDGSVLVAFDKDTGKELWRALSAKEPGYCPPSLIEAGGTRQLVHWNGEAVTSVDPETGRPYWSVELEPAYGMSIMAPRRWNDYLFAGGIGFKAVMLRLAPDRPAATEVWRGKPGTAVYPVNSTPFIEGGVIYGVDQPGALRAVRVETGERLWETFKPVVGRDHPPGDRVNSATAFLVKNGDRFFLFGENGDLVIAKLSPKGYEEVSRAKLLEPTSTAFGRSLVWSHPAFAERCIFARNDKELVCASLAAE